MRKIYSIKRKRGWDFWFHFCVFKTFFYGKTKSSFFSRENLTTEEEWKFLQKIFYIVNIWRSMKIFFSALFFHSLIQISWSSEKKNSTKTKKPIFHNFPNFFPLKLIFSPLMRQASELKIFCVVHYVRNSLKKLTREECFISTNEV